MTDARNQQDETEVLMDDTAGEVSLQIPDMDAGPSAETPSSSGELADEQMEAEVSVVYNLGHLLRRVLTLFSIITNYDNNDSGCASSESTFASSCYSSATTHTVPRVAGNLTAETEEFLVGARLYQIIFFGMEFQEDRSNEFHQLFSLWNTFLQPVQGVRVTSAIISSDIHGDINKFTPWLEEHRAEQWKEDNKNAIKGWLPRWNMFLQERAGQTLVTQRNVCLTIVGLILYIVDLVSDVGTSIYYTANGQWWRAMGTLTIVYGAVIFQTVQKWRAEDIHCTGAADWLRYVASSLVNWPDLEEYGALCLVEWKLHKSPACSAHLVPECCIPEVCGGCVGGVPAGHPATLPSGTRSIRALDMDRLPPYCWGVCFAVHGGRCTGEIIRRNAG